MRHLPSLALASGALVTAGLALAAVVVACSGPSQQQIGIAAPPYSTDSFSPVGDYLNQRCGTLDCHGQPGRNLRVYGCVGMRLDGGVPAVCNRANKTTEQEYLETYRSLVGLEPQVMTQVYNGSSGIPGCKNSLGSDGGAQYPPPGACHPELLTFIRKARGTEAHKGGQLICVTPPCPPGITLDEGGLDPQDVCLVSWLEGATDGISCGAALGTPNFPIPDAGTE